MYGHNPNHFVMERFTLRAPHLFRKGRWKVPLPAALCSNEDEGESEVRVRVRVRVRWGEVDNFFNQIDIQQWQSIIVVRIDINRLGTWYYLTSTVIYFHHFAVKSVSVFIVSHLSTITWLSKEAKIINLSSSSFDTDYYRIEGGQSTIPHDRFSLESSTISQACSGNRLPMDFFTWVRTTPWVMRARGVSPLHHESIRWILLYLSMYPTIINPGLAREFSIAQSVK